MAETLVSNNTKNNTATENTPIASVPARLLGFLIDLAVVGFVGGVLFFLAFNLFLTNIPKDDLSIIIQYVTFFVFIYILILIWCYWLYLVIMGTVTHGGSIGRFATSTRVISAYGNSVSLSAILSREVIKMVLHGVPIAHFVALFQKEHRGVHDFLAKTKVVRYDWPRKKWFRIIGLLSILLFAGTVYWVQDWLAVRTAEILNISKNDIFDQLATSEDETAGQSTTQGTPEEIFYASLFNGTHSEEEIEESRSRFNNGLYNESDIMLLFSSDTDLDGVSDSLENKYQTNTRAKDTDSDGVSDLAEMRAGTSPLGAKEDLFQSTETPQQVLNEQDFNFLISYPVGWAFRKNSSGDYSFSTINASGDLNTPLISLLVEPLNGRSLPLPFYGPEIYRGASVIRVGKTGDIPVEIVYFDLGIRMAVLRVDNTLVRIFEVLPDELEDGVLDSFVTSFQLKK